MFENVLLPETQALLKKLKASNLPKGTYLAGGTAAALHLGHRRSVDLDFFAPLHFKESQWEQELEESLGFQPLQRDWQTIIGTIGNVKFSLLGYKYKILDKPTKLYDILAASLPDIAAMKLDTLTRRGTKRDLIDIYFFAQKFSLRELFVFYGKKYGRLKEKQLLLEKALIFFDEADQDEMPDMLIDTHWPKIKAWLRKEVLNTS